MTHQLRELRILYFPARGVSTTTSNNHTINQPSDAAALLQERIGNEPVEVCLILLLNTRHQVIALHELSRGTLDSCSVHPRDVFKAAILANAAVVIVGHNHPSGDPTPSADDVSLCTRLRAAGELIGIDVLDFVIVGDGRYLSFKEAGR